MSWMQQLFAGIEIGDVTIYSKCISAINGYVPPGSVILQLANLGRCDHSYANWMTNMEEKDNTGNHIVLFFKASRRIHQGAGMSYRSLKEMIRISMHHGFSCEMKPDPYRSTYYHDVSELRGFALAMYRNMNIKSPYADMGHWLDEMGIELPTPVTPVCYSGNFAIKASQIYPKRDILKNVEASLTRGDNIEEGHFAERIWAELFSYPLTSKETDVVHSIPTKVLSAEAGYVGTLLVY